MISQIFQSIRKPVNQPPKVLSGRTPTPADRTRAQQFMITAEEFVRRDDIVRQMWLDCMFYINEVCEPVNEQSKTLYGKCTIKKICHSYHDFTTHQGMNWPTDDRPLIVSAEPEHRPDGVNMILCTPKYLRRASYSMGTC